MSHLQKMKNELKELCDRVKSLEASAHSHRSPDSAAPSGDPGYRREDREEWPEDPKPADDEEE